MAERYLGRVDLLNDREAFDFWRALIAEVFKGIEVGPDGKVKEWRLTDAVEILTEDRPPTR